MLSHEEGAREKAIVLTEKGRALLPIFYEMTGWGEKYLGDEGMLER